MNSNTLAAAAAAILLLTACGDRAGQPETETTGTAQNVSETSTATATTTGVTGGSISAMSNDEKEFVSTAGMAGLYQVQTAMLARQRAADPAVKEFAERMITGHLRLNEELSQLATVKGLALPTELAGDHQAAAEHLSTLTGAEFDRAYMQHMIADHQKEIGEFEKTAHTAADADVKAWAASAVPLLKEHERLARDVAAKLP